MVRLKLIESADGTHTPKDGMYLVDYIPDTDELGLGELHASPDVTDAKIFADASSAFAYWKQQSKRVPLRTDGKPNRPLTAWSVLIETVEKSHE
jgi:hypothetical protein